MATVFETRLIGNIGKDAIVKTMERGVIAINFPVAHNKNWKDKRTGETKTKTTWINCTIWKREGVNLRILDFLKKGALVELEGTPYAKAYQQEDGSIRTEIRLNISKTNVLKAVKSDGFILDDIFESDSCTGNDENFDSSLDEFTIDESDF
ncbi:MAG: single-stranded DNA-binding protein [Flavobacteriia bacterium]|nr:single-stranded DNA-binding protein [Flavobacteriia bacterium]